MSGLRSHRRRGGAVAPRQHAGYRLKQWHGIATRYEKTATIYLTGLHIAGIFLWSAR
ncbi:hypothetical protein [Streptomyces diastatochromogenes]|uniref:hypothetical protein n=1 Tax=Streptomyces diastatochromogenes TaxID=42236 RepID=UPI00142E3BB1|nr:hypothetical protein [Streptomyces diastatochromogenes]MCZ0988594.1 hypothetical protein [Streptomyces diastatochromogenes]